MPTKDDKIKPKTAKAKPGAKAVSAKLATPKAAAPKPVKPRVPRKKAAPAGNAAGEVIAAAQLKVQPADNPVAAQGAAAEPAITLAKPKIAGGRYVFATGRRKTAVANVRLFSGKGDSTVNKKPLNTYFAHVIYQNEIMKPLEVTGLASDFHFTATINGGGIHAQSHALRHGIAQALASFNDDIKRVLKKNTFLTRDDRKKERKKPGLKRARRSPQWAKR